METLACSGCGAALPDGLQLCSNCGGNSGESTSTGATATIIDVPATVVAHPRAPRQPAWPLPRRRQRPRIGLLWLALLLPFAIWWATASNRPGAQQLQGLFT